MNTVAVEVVSDVNWFAAVQLPHNWTDVSFGSPDLRLCSVTYQELEGCSPLVVTRSLIVKQDYTWVLNVHGHPVDPSNISSLALIPHNLTRDLATLLLSRLEELNTCVGNPEPKFVSLGEAKKKGQLKSLEKEVVAYVDSSACVGIGHQQYAHTIRCMKCHLLTTEVRCSECAAYRKNLLAQHSRARRRSTSVQRRTTNFRCCVCLCLSVRLCALYIYTMYN